MLAVGDQNGFPNFLVSVKLERQGRGPRLRGEAEGQGAGGGGVGAKQMGVGGGGVASGGWTRTGYELNPEWSWRAVIDPFSVLFSLYISWSGCQ